MVPTNEKRRLQVPSNLTQCVKCGGLGKLQVDLMSQSRWIVVAKSDPADYC